MAGSWPKLIVKAIFLELKAIKQLGLGTKVFRKSSMHPKFDHHQNYLAGNQFGGALRCFYKKFKYLKRDLKAPSNWFRGKSIWWGLILRCTIITEPLT